MHRLPRAFRLRQQQPLVLRRIHQQRNITQLLRRNKPQYLQNPADQPLRYHAVRFKKPPFLTWRRAATIALYSGVTYAYINLLFRYLDVEIEILDDDQISDEEKQKGQKKVDERAGGQDVTEQQEEGPFYAEEDSTFIPMTWAKKLPRSFYKGSDTEWQEFVKIAKDKPRHKKIQDELVQMVFTGSTKHPAVTRQLGKDMKVGKYWLDISFPDGPPQEYERSGVEIGDGFVAWSQQKVSAEQQWRLTRALWPRAAFESLYATSKVLFGIQYRRIKQALGWEGADPFSPEEKYRHAIEMMQKQQQGRMGKTQTPDGLPGGGVVGSGTATDTPTTPPKPSPSAASDGKKLPWAISVPMPSTSAATTTDIPIAMHVFSATLSKQWNPKKSEPPRGSFVVQGLVEVRGQRGRMLFDVQSCYDPKTGKFVAVNAAVRNFKRWNQAPRGGP